MKSKILHFFVYSVLAILILNSCNKQEDLLLQGETNEEVFLHRSTDEDICDEMDSLCIQDGMIVFKDTSVFRKVVDFIDHRHKIWMGIYLGNSITAEYKVTNKFEQKLNFNSLQGQINTERMEWLGHEDLDMENDPDDKWIEGVGLRTVLNINGAVKIGKSIYVTRQNGNCFDIQDADINTLNLILGGQETSLAKTLLYTPNGSIIDAEANKTLTLGDSCISFRQTSDHIVYGQSGNRKMKGKSGIYSFVFFTLITTETDHFRKLGPIWFKHKADFISADGSGNLYDNDCGEKGTISLSDDGYNKNTIADSRGYWGLGDTRALKTNEWSSFHYAEDNGYQSLVLQLDL